MPKKYRGVIFARSIIIADSLPVFYHEVAQALEELEQAAQMFGCGEALLTDEDETLPIFSTLPDEYKAPGS